MGQNRHPAVSELERGTQGAGLFRRVNGGRHVRDVLIPIGVRWVGVRVGYVRQGWDGVIEQSIRLGPI